MHNRAYLSYCTQTHTFSSTSFLNLRVRDKKTKLKGRDRPYFSTLLVLHPLLVILWVEGSAVHFRMWPNKWILLDLHKPWPLLDHSRLRQRVEMEHKASKVFHSPWIWTRTCLGLSHGILKWIHRPYVVGKSNNTKCKSRWQVYKVLQYAMWRPPTTTLLANFKKEKAVGS